MPDTSRLQRALGYEFIDPHLLSLALTHRSAGGRNNERLEFLGDSIVNHIIAEALYHQFPRSREGDMSRMRASLVKGDTLAEVARELQLGEYLQLGPGERKSGGHRRGSILADAFEAVVGAILLDSNVERCRQCVLAWFAPRLQQLTLGGATRTPKPAYRNTCRAATNPADYELLAWRGRTTIRNFVWPAACRSRPWWLKGWAAVGARRSRSGPCGPGAIGSLCN